jgi:Sulfotransferase domain
MRDPLITGLILLRQWLAAMRSTVNAELFSDERPRPYPRNHRRVLSYAMIISLCLIAVWTIISQGLLLSVEQDGRVDMESDVQPSDLKITLFMTFPNSGTTYTLQMLASLTGLHAATVYGSVIDNATDESDISVYPGESGGPYWLTFRQNYTGRPKRYVLVKTHCSGGEALGPLEVFINLCLRCNHPRNHSINNNVARQASHSQINTTRVKKAVHLMRDPFDNVVARYHYVNRKKLGNLEPSHDGFRAFCQQSDLSANSYEKKVFAPYISMVGNLTCKLDFMRYFQWHNNAISAISAMKLDSLFLRYEDYGTQFDSTVQSLVDFMHMSPLEGRFASQFIAGKHYRDHYTADDLVKAKQLYLAMASNETRGYMDVYFEGID